MSNRWDSQLEAYLDDQLSLEEQREFAIRLQEDARLRAAVAQQRRIDDSLRRQMSIPTDAPQFELPSDLGAMLHPSSPRRVFWRRFSIAAMLAICLLGAAASLMVLFNNATSQTQLTRLSFQDYFALKAKDFKPYWVCENNDQFASSFRDRLGQALLLQPLPAGVTARGLDYCYTITPRTVAVLMLADEQKIIVLVDRLNPRNHQPLPSLKLPKSDLYFHQRVIGSLVLYEISNSDQPQMLDLFYDPDAEPDKAAAPGKWQ